MAATHDDGEQRAGDEAWPCRAAAEPVPSVLGLVDEKGAEDHQAALGEVDDAGGAEDHDEAERDERVDRAQRQAVRQQREELRHPEYILSMRSWNCAAAIPRRTFCVAVERAGLLEVDGEQLEPLDLLVLVDLSVHLAHRALHQPAYLDLLHEVPLRRELEVLLLGPDRDHPDVDADERGEIGPAVADDHRVTDERRELEQVLELVGRDVDARRRHDDVLRATRDRQEPVGVDLAEVAAAQPTVVVRGLRRGLVTQVAEEVPRAADEHLPAVGDAQLRSGKGPADLADANVVFRCRGGQGRVLGLAVHLAHRDAERPEVLEHVGGDRRRPRQRDAYPGHAELLSKRPTEEEPRQESRHGAAAPATHASGRDFRPPPLPHVVVPPLQPAGVPNPELDARREALPHAGNAEEERGLHLAQVVRERLASFAEVHDVAGPHRGDD